MRVHTLSVCGRETNIFNSVNAGWASVRVCWTAMVRDCCRERGGRREGGGTGRRGWPQQADVRPLLSCCKHASLYLASVVVSLLQLCLSCKHLVSVSGIFRCVTAFQQLTLSLSGCVWVRETGWKGKGDCGVMRDCVETVCNAASRPPAGSADLTLQHLQYPCVFAMICRCTPSVYPLV